ncbi:hypothetical protein [Asticcacaulis excentricus]|uniref:Glycerophosphoryl diester phosphodiesterase membrane domain-containing protein n=1 Tax=Asticcacaulis excentricus (strain ATCC 15261 / DSM 4724 / KCTC 12464 / NCIMB 9791 / VKM B-1370 / CB 48) TaxID=573065 RepID=E8RNM4_ASTEC|nr:hypothetical protein [Asticcacaulis excentricus]ADU12920.1 hypothetical protein Astex_1245 [Asticcacaulis excentricus CB 48]
MASSVDFAFEGFRIIRERPILIAWWGAVLLVALILSTALLMSVAGPEWNALIQGQVPNEPEKAAELLVRLGPAYVLALMVTLVFSAIITCAVYRAVLGGHSPQFGFLRLGADEVRQMALSFVLAVVIIVVTLLITVVLAILGGLLSLLVGAVSQAVAPVVGVLTAIAAMIFNIWLMVRLSMVSVQSFDEGHFNLTGSLKLTQGRFWSLLGGFAVAFLMALVVSMLAQTVYMALAVLVTGRDVASVEDVPQPDVSQLANLMEPLTGVYLAVNGVIAPLTTAIMIGAVAAAYQTLKNTPNT